MADDTTEKPNQGEGKEPSTEKAEPAAPDSKPVIAGAEGPETPQPPAEAAKPSPPSAEKPAPPKAAPAAGHKPAPPAKKGPTITFDITGDALIDRIRERFGDAITEAVATLGQQIIRVKKASFIELCSFLHDDEEALFDMCTDLTAIHWPQRAGEEFEVVILLIFSAEESQAASEGFIG